MNNDDKINIYLTLMAYTQGSWTPEQVEKSYEYLLSKVNTAKPELKLVEQDIEIH